MNKISYWKITDVGDEYFAKAGLCRLPAAKGAATRKRRKKKRDKIEVVKDDDPRVKPDYSRKCIVCDASPVVPETGMCGPCTFGEADTADGNW